MERDLREEASGSASHWTGASREELARICVERPRAALGRSASSPPGRRRPVIRRGSVLRPDCGFTISISAVASAFARGLAQWQEASRPQGVSGCGDVHSIAGQNLRALQGRYSMQSSRVRTVGTLCVSPIWSLSSTRQSAHGGPTPKGSRCAGDAPPIGARVSGEAFVAGPLTSKVLSNTSQYVRCGR